MGLAQCCGYFVSIMLMLISGIVFVCFLLAYISHIKTFFYKEGECIITDTIYTVQYACTCGRECKAAYPCILIYAKVNASDQLDVGLQWPIVVYDDDYQQIRVLSASPEFEERCSVRVCVNLNQDNRDEVERYRLFHGQPGMRLRCYYDGNSLAQRGAVFNRRIHWSLVFHVLFWPGIAFVTGIGTCAYFCYSRKRKRTRFEIEDRLVPDSRRSGGKF